MDRFQEFAANLAEKAGAWQHFAFWAGLLAVWIALGPFMHWSDSWQLIANTPTTWYELFLGLALLVDGAGQILMLRRMLAHLTEQQDRLQRLEEHALALEEQIAAALGVQDRNDA